MGENEKNSTAADTNIDTQNNKSTVQNPHGKPKKKSQMRKTFNAILVALIGGLLVYFFTNSMFFNDFWHFLGLPRTTDVSVDSGSNTDSTATDSESDVGTVDDDSDTKPDTVSFDSDSAPELFSDPMPKPSLLTFSLEYSGKAARLAPLNDNIKRYFPRLGPGTDYAQFNYGYKPSTTHGITAFFEENGYLFCDVRSGAEERYVFFSSNIFDDNGNVPQITSLPYYTGTTTSAVDPRWGPSNGFNVVEDYTASAGTSLRIFFQENGFVYAEYSCSKGLVRMWLPADKINCSDAVITK